MPKLLREPTIHLLIGSTGAGKSTYAIKLVDKHQAVRFAIDEWMQNLFAPDSPSEIEFNWIMERIERCEALMWQVAKSVLDAGNDVALEMSASTRALRNKQIERARTSGYPLKAYYLDVDRETRRQRVMQRNQHQGNTFSFEVTPGMFDFVENMFEEPNREEIPELIVLSDG